MKAIKTKPILANSKHPFRTQAQDIDGNKILVPFDFSLSEKANHLIAAERFAKHMGWGGVFHGAYSGKQEMHWVGATHDNEETFTILKPNGV